jgi:hypothetical protein
MKENQNSSGPLKRTFSANGLSKSALCKWGKALELLQTDGYAGYEALCKRNDIVGFGCLSHARRKFSEVVKISGEFGKKMLGAFDIS